MKIFLSFMNGVGGDCRQVPCFYEAFIKGLVDAGNELLVYSRYGMPYPGDPQERAQVCAAVRSWQPDLIVAFNNYGPDWTDVCDCPVVVYEVDSPLYYDNRDSIRAKPDRYVFLVLQEKTRQVLVEELGVSSSRIFLTHNFTSVAAEEKPFERNIVFVGSRFWSPSRRYPWCEFRDRNPTDRELLEYRRMLKSVAENPFQSAEAIGGAYPSVAPDAQGLSNLIGALSGEKRVRLMSALADLGLEIYGTHDWVECGSDPAALALAYRDRKVFSLADNQKLYNTSKLGVNINHLQAVSTFSWRVYDIMASSGCLVTEYRPDVKRLFPDVPIPTFTDEYEARQICKRLLANESERQDIIAACHAAIERIGRFDSILSILEGATGLCLHGEGSGVVSYVQVAQTDVDSLPMKRKSSPHYGLNGFRLMLSAVPGIGRLVNREKVLARLGVAER